MKKIILFLMLFAIFFCNTAFAENAGISEWAVPEVTEAVRLGIVPEDMQQNYQENMTRGEFAKISVLFVAYQLNMDFEDAMNWYLETHVDGHGNKLQFKTDSFHDINNSDHAYYIRWANALGIVKGRSEGLFEPDAPITREEAATMLLRAYFCYGSGVKLGPESMGVDAFADALLISPWADMAVRYMYQWGVMKGISEAYYSPKTTYTKEQCYVTLLRLDKVDN